MVGPKQQQWLLNLTQKPNQTKPNHTAELMKHLPSTCNMTLPATAILHNPATGISAALPATAARVRASAANVPRP